MVLSVKNMKVGAGGLITGIDIHSDGTRVCRADVFGGYCYDPLVPNPGNAGGSGKWRQLVTTDSMSTELGSSGLLSIPLWMGDGIHEIRIAPTNSNIFYMMFAYYFWVSYDKGHKWYRTNLPKTAIEANFEHQHLLRYKFAIDPLNSDVVHFRTPANGSFYTLDGGRSWQVPTGLPSNDTSHLSCVAIDTSSSATGGRKATVYQSVSGTGLYKSTDGGLTYSAVGGAGQPTSIGDLLVSSAGVVYAADSADGFGYRLNAGTWTNITPTGAGGVTAFSLYPSDNLKVIAWPFQNNPQQTANGTTVTSGSGWSAAAASPSSWVATDCPALATLSISLGGSNGILTPVIDPTDETKAYVSTQQGVFMTALPPAASPSVNTYTSVNSGIEEVVANSTFLSPGGFAPLLCGQDVGIIQQANDTKYALSKVWNPTSFLTFGANVDAAKNDPSFVACAMNFQQGGSGNPAGFSTDGGSNWTAFGADPDITLGGGCIAVSTSLKMIWVKGGATGNVWYTSDGGNTWGNISGMPSSQWSNSAIFFNRIPVVADPNQSGRFVLQYGGTVGSGTYIVDNGVITSSSANTIDSVGSASTTGESASIGANNGVLRAVPGHAGHFFWTKSSTGSGRSSVATDFPAGAKLWFTSNYGVTWTDVGSLSSNNFTIRDVWKFTVGAVQPGQSYPALYLYGWVVAGSSAPPSGSLPGIWASFDQGVTWSQIGPQHPTGWPDFIRTLDADPLVFGKLVLGFAGSGWAVANLTTSGGLRLGQVR